MLIILWCQRRNIRQNMSTYEGVHSDENHTIEIPPGLTLNALSDISTGIFTSSLIYQYYYCWYLFVKLVHSFSHFVDISTGIFISSLIYQYYYCYLFVGT